MADVLILAGEAEFKKEHLKVKIDTHGNLKVSGERPLGVGGDRWRRFQKLFRMADDCITTDIKAKFDNGILSVAMPKLIRDQPSATLPPPPAAPQTPSAAPAAPPAKPDPRMEAASRKAPEEGQAQAAATAEGGRSDSARDKKAGEPAPEPAPPQAPKYGTGTRRRWRQVVAGVVVVVMVAAAVGLGIYYWSHWKGVTPDEQQQQMDICLSEY